MAGSSEGRGAATRGKEKRGYDSLTAAEVVRGLPRLPTDALGRLRAYEESHKGRTTVLKAVDALLRARQAEEEDVSADEQCRNCGEALGGDARFCPECGTPVAASAPTSPA